MTSATARPWLSGAGLFRPTWWLTPPLLIAALMVPAVYRATQELDELRYEGVYNGEWFDHEPSVADITDRIRRDEAELRARPSRDPQVRRNLLENVAREYREAPATRDRIIRKHDADVALLRDDRRISLTVGLGALLLAFPFQWAMRGLRPGRLLSAVDGWLSAPPKPENDRPRARLILKDGTSYSARTVHTLAALSVLTLAAGILLILYVAGQPNGPSNIAPLVLGAVFVVAGLLSAPFQIRWVLWLNRAQRALDRKILNAQQAVEAFRRQTAHGAAAINAGTGLTARDDEFHIDLQPAPLPPSPASVARSQGEDDGFRIDLPPGKAP